MQSKHISWLSSQEMSEKKWGEGKERKKLLWLNIKIFIYYCLKKNRERKYDQFESLKNRYTRLDLNLDKQ